MAGYSAVLPLSSLQPWVVKPQSTPSLLQRRPFTSLALPQRFSSQSGHDRHRLTCRAASSTGGKSTAGSNSPGGSFSPGGNPDEFVVKGDVGQPADTVSGVQGMPAAGIQGMPAEQLVKADVGKPAETPQFNKPVKATTKKASSTRSTAKKQTAQGADAVKEGVEDGAEAVQDAVGGSSRQVREGVADAASAIEEGIDNVEEGIEDAIDDAPKEVRDAVQSGVNTASNVIEDVRGALDDAPPPGEVAQQAVDGVADAIKTVRTKADEALQPGPSAPYASARLTALPAFAPASQEGKDKADYYKTRLLYCISGLDRGFAANQEAVSTVEDAVSALVNASEPVSLAWTAGEGAEQSTLAQLNGTWRLLYSSAFTRGSLGGRQPGPSLVSAPFALGQVYQAISTYTARLDNIVELVSRLNLPALPGGPKVDPIIVTASLKHNFEALGGSTCQITFEDVEVKATGGLGAVLGNLPEFSLPQLPEPLRPSRQQRTSLFDLLYLDDDMRITRGSRGELRIFTRI